MNLELTKNDNTMVAAFSGKLDSTNSEDALKKIMKQLDKDKPEKFVFDVKDLLYISSAGIRIINNLDIEMQNRGGEFYLSGVHDLVEEVLDLTGILKIIKTLD